MRDFVYASCGLAQLKQEVKFPAGVSSFCPCFSWFPLSHSQQRSRLGCSLQTIVTPMLCSSASQHNATHCHSPSMASWLKGMYNNSEWKWMPHFSTLPLDTWVHRILWVFMTFLLLLLTSNTNRLALYPHHSDDLFKHWILDIPEVTAATRCKWTVLSKATQYKCIFNYVFYCRLCCLFVLYNAKMILTFGINNSDTQKSYA